MSNTINRMAVGELTAQHQLDNAGNITYSVGTTVPGDVAGYAKGSLFVDTDVADGTSGLYVNVGTTASALFKLVTNAA